MTGWGRKNWWQEDRETRWQKSRYDPPASKTREIKVVMDGRERVEVYCGDRILVILQLMEYRVVC